MTSPSVLVLEGNLEPDGTIRLDRPPDVPAGRVRITLHPLPTSEPEAVCIPDGPWLDDAIPAPFDLPLPSAPERVHPRQAADLLPDPIAGTAEHLG